MSDAERRQRSRRAEGLEERAGALRAALRSGVLSAERLRLAAHLGDPAAAALLAEDDEARGVPADVHEWFAGLRAFGAHPWLRAIGALIRPRLVEAASAQAPALGPLSARQPDLTAKEQHCQTRT